MCHVSHLYPHGASLYFTVLTPRATADAVGQWTRAKGAASDAIVAAGATITHHHAVGTDHRDWMAAEVGDRGVDVLRAVKATLDPAGVLNPGKLIREEPECGACSWSSTPRPGAAALRRLLPAVGGALRGAGHDLVVTPTRSLEHADELTAQAVADDRVAVAMGGDGIVGRVAGALPARHDGRPARRARQRLLPGRRHPARPCGARARVLATGVEHAVDLGVVTSADGARAVPRHRLRSASTATCRSAC